MIVSRDGYSTAGRRVDLAIYSREGLLQVIVEVKARFDASPEWAAHLRRNFVIYEVVPRAPFFLLSLPDHFYLWREADKAPATAAPSYTVDPAPLLSPYLRDEYRLSRRLDNMTLELAVSAWLREVVASDLHEGAFAPDQAWLFESGLYRAIHRGFVETDVRIVAP